MINKNIIIILIALVSVLSFLILIEIISRKNKFLPDCTRRISHIGASFFIIFFAGLLNKNYFIFILGLFVVIIFISRKLNIFNHIHGISHKSCGEELLPFGCLVAYVILQGNMTLFVPTVLVVGLADPAAGIAIQCRKGLIFSFLIFTLISFIVLLLFSSLPIITVILLSLFLATIEKISGLGTDNFTIPVFTAIILSLIS